MTQTYLHPHLHSPDLRSKRIEPVRQTEFESKTNLREKPGRKMAQDTNASKVAREAVPVNEKTTSAGEAGKSSIRLKAFPMIAHSRDYTRCLRTSEGLSCVG